MVEDLLEQLILIINPREKVTADRVRMLNGRLKDKYTPDEIIESAIEFSKSQWHKDNGQMSIDNLLRPSKFGRWYAARKPRAIESTLTEAQENIRIKNKQKEMMDIF